MIEQRLASEIRVGDYIMKNDVYKITSISTGLIKSRPLLIYGRNENGQTVYEVVPRNMLMDVNVDKNFVWLFK